MLSRNTAQSVNLKGIQQQWQNVKILGEPAPLAKKDASTLHRSLLTTFIKDPDILVIYFSKFTLTHIVQVNLLSPFLFYMHPTSCLYKAELSW